MRSQLLERPVPATAREESRRVWIDLDNTPHVPFFVPIIRALERDGHSVIVTARDAFQVCSLADYHGLEYRTIGRHNGPRTVLKVIGTLWRTAQLLPMVLRERPHVSISLGSRAAMLASALLGIPSMEILDYEHAHRLPIVKPALGVAPASLDRPPLARAFRHGLRTYDGLKEDVYARSLRPDPTVLDELGVGADEILVTMRPPANSAHYHNPESEALFSEIVAYLAEVERVRMVILPRTVDTGREVVLRTWPRLYETRRIIIPARALDGLNLIWFSDLVVSGGGTMNREAAAVGVPVYSIFRGRLGNVDRCLVREGRLILLESVDDVRTRLKVVKRDRPLAPALMERPALSQILAAAAELMELARARD